MSKVGQWVFGMQEDAYHMSREQFIQVHGASQVDIWDRCHQEEFEYEPDYDEAMEHGFYGS